MSNVHLYDKILSPFVTEKSTNLSEQNKIIFKVPNKANKKNLKTILFSSDKLVDFSVTTGDRILSYKCIFSILWISLF